MTTDRKHDTGQPPAQRAPAKPRANTPRDESEAARRSGQFGADKRVCANPPPPPERGSDNTPNDKGPEYEEGGQYPGKRPGGK
jgi:hypothetical protein